MASLNDSDSSPSGGTVTSTIAGVGAAGSGLGGLGVLMDPYCVSTSDVHTGSSIVKKVLTGRENYVTWRKAMEIALSARSQLGFVRGEYPRPTDPAMLARWQRCNDIVMSWLICSVSENVGEQIMRAKDVMTAWNILKTRYAGTNLARKSVLQTEVANCVQGDCDVATYFDKLSKYWEELDSIKKIRSCAATGVCPCCLETEADVEEDRVVKFLMGLNDAYAVVRSNVFAMKQVPNIDVVYDIVSQEESQMKAKRGVQTESSAFYGGTNHQNYQGKNNNGGKGKYDKEKEKLVCSHCQMTGHLKENCYKLIGYPPGYKFKKGNQRKPGSTNQFTANNASVSSSNDSSDGGKSGVQLTSEQVNQLLALLRSGNADQCSAPVQMAGPIPQETSRDW